MIRVLFFDDDSRAAHTLMFELREEYGWKGEREIDIVNNARSLFRRINNDKTKYDLFVLDRVAPIEQRGFSQEEINEMHDGLYTGFVIAKRIRMYEKYKEVPILFFSLDFYHRSELNNVYYMSKYVPTKELSELMKEILKIS